MNILKIGQSEMPSVINDPFKKTKVTGIRVSVYRGWDDKWSAQGSVDFINGDTKGEQSFKGESFDDVVLKIKAMLDNLD